MRKLVVAALGLFVVLGVSSSSALAIKPFNDEFVKLYVGDNKDSALAKAIDKVKCDLCHVEKAPKKQRNEYGMAVAKLLKKSDFGPDALKDPEKVKLIAEALKKVEAEKSKDGKTFGEKIKAGELPAAK